MAPTIDDYYDWQDNCKGSHSLAIASIREMRIREGVIAPETPQEWRWYGEGPVPESELDTLKRKAKR
jgi:hypothetical protein